MHTEDTMQLSKYFGELIAATEQRQIVWSQVNPSTFVYDPVARSGKAIIQRVSPHLPIYVFQIVKGDEIKLEIEGSPTDPDGSMFTGSLDELFSTIKRARDKDGLDAFKSLLP